MAARKRKRVPDVLWRLFGNRARTLADTILALIPPPPVTEAACRCKGRRCLSCSGDEAMSFLLRSRDSPDYRRLLTGCFVVVSEDAPPTPVVSDLHSRWSQLEVSRSSAAVDELTSSKWTVLLQRVGDSLMMYLLKYTSIFLPLPRKKHHQISGYPIGNLCSKFSRSMPESRSQHHPLAYRGGYSCFNSSNSNAFSRLYLLSGHEVKRKRVEENELPRKKLRPNTVDSEPSSTMNGYTSQTQNEGNLNQNTLMFQKRRRAHWCEAQRKRRQLDVQGTPTSDDMGNIARCLCCSVFQIEPRMKGNAEISRKNIFYRIDNCSSLLPRKHLLHTLKPNGSGASVLFNNIFQTNAGSAWCCHRKNGGPINSTCLYHSLTKLLRSLIFESQNCEHVKLLEKHCPDRSSYQDATMGAGTGPEVAMAKNGTMIPENNSTQVEPIKYCLKNQVVSFIWAICRRIVPSPLLGEPSNWRILTRNISKFIRLRRFEKFSLKECIYKLNISKFPIFSEKHTGCSGLGITDIAAILECWIFWFFEHLVSPLVQANFYVTESEHEKQEVQYYRKSTWEKFMREDECMTNDQYCLVNIRSARNILGKRSFGFSRARLRPKNKGFRMLTNLGAPSRLPVEQPPSRIHSNQKSWRTAFCNRRVESRFFKPVNSVLHDVHVVLKGLQVKEPEKLGSSVFDYNDIYKKLVLFLFHLKNGSTSLPNVFMVVSDVSKAFDSVSHEKLLSVMKDVIFDDEFTLEKFTQVICTRKSLKIDQHLMLAHQDIVAASTRIRSRRAQSLDGIVFKKELIRKIRNEEISSLLKEHITRNVVQLGNKFYLQRVGIPQGSVLSTLLCSFYYGHMERNVFYPFLEKSHEALLAKHHSPGDTSALWGNHKMEISAPGCEYLLLRFIDDIFFISTSKKQASMFFSRLERGVRDYNCCMNEEKYGLNFIMDNRPGCHSNRLHIGKDSISFLRWSGLLVNCSTLEIQADYTRYLNYHLSSSLTVCRLGKVGQNLKAKLKSYLRPKCHPIFYDSNINSPAVVRLNIYQTFLLCAMKFICHLSNLSILPRFHPKFCANAIENSLRYMNRLIKRKIHSFRVDPSFRPRYDVKQKDVMWLGLYAFSRVLKKKQLRYKTLLHLIRSKLKAYGEVENMPSEVKYAVDDVHSSVLWSIKF